MSYEYTIRFQEPHADQVLTVLRKIAVFAYENQGHIALKDSNIENSWKYDVRVFVENQYELFLEITTRTPLLYFSLKSALSGINYQITEYEDSEPTSLERAFRHQ